MADLGRYMAVVRGDARGPGGVLARAGLHALSVPYGLIVGLRNHHFDRFRQPRWLDVPVVSVGNLTVGGTGKTPMTIWLAKWFLTEGLKPAVLSRGYKASAGQSPDELLLVNRHCPEAVAVANPDRFAAGGLAVEEYGAQVAILDDGFQHRRVGRDLDVVLIDARCPFGYGHLLPRGLLRESPAGLARADLVVVTRCDQVDDVAVAEIEREIGRYNPEVPIVRAVHEAAGFADLSGNVVERPPAGVRLGCFAGIARPDAFVRTLEGVGCDPVDGRWWPDHHAYDDGDVATLHGWVEQAQLEALVTTEKDAVKLVGLGAEWSVPVYVVRVEMAFRGDGADRVGEVLHAMLDEHRQFVAQRDAAELPPVVADDPS